MSDPMYVSLFDPEMGMNCPKMLQQLVGQIEQKQFQVSAEIMKVLKKAGVKIHCGATSLWVTDASGHKSDHIRHIDWAQWPEELLETLENFAQIQSESLVS